MADRDDRFAGGDDEGDAWVNAFTGGADARAAELLSRARSGDREALVQLLRLAMPGATDAAVAAAADRVTPADLAAMAGDPPADAPPAG